MVFMMKSIALGKEKLGRNFGGGVWQSASKPHEGTPRKGARPLQEALKELAFSQ